AALDKLTTSPDSVDLATKFDSVNEKLDTAVKSILGGVRKQQHVFVRTIEDKFEAQSAEATRTLQDALRKELSIVVPNSGEREHVTSRFGELMLHAIQ